MRHCLITELLLFPQLLGAIMAKICKTKAATSERKLAANRANAQKSSGPKTASGKERSRLNALKHGMRSEHDFLPGELDAKVQTAFQKWKDQLRPEGYVETTLVHQAARCSCKLEWLDTQFNAVVTRQVRTAGYRFDARERKAAFLESETLETDPSGTLETLQKSVAGCELLLDEWNSLLDSLAAGWTDEQSRRALLLLGQDPAHPQSADLPPFDCDRIQAIMAQLVQLRDENNASVDSRLRSEAQAVAMLPRGKWGSLWPRYQGIVMKGYHQAIHDLIKIRRLDDPPRPNDFRRRCPDAPNEPNGSPQGGYSSSASDDRSAAFGAAMEKSEREQRKLAKKVEQLNLQLELREAQLRATERRGHGAPIEPKPSAQKGVFTKGSVKTPGALSQAFKAASILIVIFLAAWATGMSKPSIGQAGNQADRSGKPSETARKTTKSSVQLPSTAETRTRTDGNPQARRSLRSISKLNPLKS